MARRSMLDGNNSFVVPIGQSDLPHALERTVTSNRQEFRSYAYQIALTYIMVPVLLVKQKLSLPMSAGSQRLKRSQRVESQPICVPFTRPALAGQFGLRHHAGGSGS